MTDRRIDLGPTGETVRENVTYLRESKNLTYAKLARQLAQVGNPIPPLGLRRIEAGERRVHVDDLIALAQVLSTTPSMLLMPRTESAEELVTITGRDETPASEVWEWMSGGQGFSELNFTGPFLRAPMWTLDVEDSIQSALELIGRIQEMQKDDRGDD